MPSSLPKNIIKLTVALLKHQAELWLGEEAVGIAGDTLIDIGGEELQERIDKLIAGEEGAKELLAATQRADDYFQKNCRDETLKGALSLSFGDLPAVQNALGKLPKAMSINEVRDELEKALQRDFPKLTQEQIEAGANLYTEALQRALLPLKDFTLPIIGQVLLDNQQKLNKLGVGQEEIKAMIKQMRPAQNVQAGWLRPSAPRPSKPMVGRKDEFNQVKNLLKPGQKAAISATVQGTPGVGKTLLAEHLAVGLGSQFPGGVIFERLGVEFRDPILANPILKKWASYAFGGQQPDEGFEPIPDEIRALMAGHGDLLIVLDDVWDLNAIKPLLDALPNETCLMVTTRNRRIAQEFHGETYSLDVLTPDDAMALLRTRLPNAKDGDEALLEKLNAALGNHAQALDIAAGSLSRLPRRRWSDAVEQMAQQVREGSGFGELQLPGDEEAESRVEAALSFSYDDLKPKIQKRFRMLGAFASDGNFRLEAATGIWKLSIEEAEDQLSVFVELGLINRLDEFNLEIRWQQHSLLRAYALALLRRENEELKSRNIHAVVHNELMKEADNKQIYYLMLPDYPQLRHAFSWALENDLELAQNLAGNTANLQATFYLVRENYAWALQLVDATKDSAEEVRGRSIGTFANALSRLANLPDEDRRARLLEALEAYTEALKFRRPDTAPLDYAMTQANLALSFMDISNFPEENREEQYSKAVKSTAIALSIFVQVGHEPYAQHTAGQLRWIAEQVGDLFLDMWDELELGELPDWLK
jgi:hypothetical protein